MNNIQQAPIYLKYKIEQKCPTCKENYITAAVKTDQKVLHDT